VTAAVFVCQLHYWQSSKDKRLNPDLEESKNEGWVWKTMEEWTEETGLSRKEQETVRVLLKKLGILEEKNERLKHRLNFRLNIEKLIEITLNPAKHSPMPESDIRECDKVTFDIGNTESTTENTATQSMSTPSVGDIAVSPLDISPPIAVAPPFDCQAYFDRMMEDKNKAICLIGNFFSLRGFAFMSAAAVQKNIKRWIRVANEIVKTDWQYEAIVHGLEYLDSDPWFNTRWDLNTLAKMLPAFQAEILASNPPQSSPPKKD